jgi:hypothetical protein
MSARFCSLIEARSRSRRLSSVGVPGCVAVSEDELELDEGLEGDSGLGAFCERRSFATLGASLESRAGGTDRKLPISATAVSMRSSCDAMTVVSLTRALSLSTTVSKMRRGSEEVEVAVLVLDGAGLGVELDVKLEEVRVVVDELDDDGPLGTGIRELDFAVETVLSLETSETV